MVQIRKLVENRGQYPLSAKGDCWIDEILSADLQDDIWFMSVASLFSSSARAKELAEIRQKYHIAGIYNVGSPFVNTGVMFYAVHLVSSPVDSVDIAIFNGRMYDKRPRADGSNGELVIADAYSEKYSKYISELEKWINEGIAPDHDKYGEYEYNTIPLEEIDENHLYPEFYSRTAMDVRNLLANEEIVSLGTVAEILQPMPISDIRGKVIKNSDLRYPFSEEEISDGEVTNVRVQKNDILFPTVGEAEPYIIPDEVTDNVYAGRYVYVIRCTSIQPEYLYLYLKSEVCQIILDSERIGTFMKRVTRKAIEEIPIIVPQESPETYTEQVAILTHVGRVYDSSTQGILEKYYALREQSKSPEKVEDILSVEIAKNVKAYNEELLRNFLTDDLTELNACFNAKAYKATLILAGSILEAVLIDWLSEIKQKDYFNDDYMVTDHRTGRQKRAELIDYINEIKQIERPHWMEEASKAHTIRKKRNLVHAKLYMKESIEVNEDSCKMVIKYLEDILKSRIL